MATPSSQPHREIGEVGIGAAGALFDVEHRNGALNHVPNALSLMFEEDDLEVSASMWASETKDKWYLHWLGEVTRDPTAYPRWKTIGEQLFFYCVDEAIETAVGEDDAWKHVVPRKKRRAVLCESPYDPTAGHFCRDKMHERLAWLYFWPKLYRSVRDFVQRCLVCQQTTAEQ